jgi:AraC-like DNA-binding protein
MHHRSGIDGCRLQHLERSEASERQILQLILGTESRYTECCKIGMHETARRSRTLYALNLLQSSDRRISETAAEAGFCDQAHMTRCFTAVVGQTPKQVQRICSQRMAMPESE